MNNIGKNSFDMGYMETLASQDSPLHRLDPRVKLLTTLLFIVCVVSFKKYAIWELAPFFLYPIVLISLGGLSYRYIFKKVLIASFFAFFVGIFNPVFDRSVFMSIGALDISGGWISFFSIIIRFVLTVSSALILISLTGFNSICWALIKFGVPKIFAVQLLFLYRYLFVLTDEAERMIRAWSFRCFNSKRISFKVFISLAGNLLLRAFDRAERVYLAMCSRGFEGDIHIIKKIKIGSGGAIFIFVWAVLFMIFRYSDFVLELGRLATGGLK